MTGGRLQSRYLAPDRRPWRQLFAAGWSLVSGSRGNCDFLIPAKVNPLKGPREPQARLPRQFRRPACRLEFVPDATGRSTGSHGNCRQGRTYLCHLAGPPASKFPMGKCTLPMATNVGITCSLPQMTSVSVVGCTDYLLFVSC